MEYTLLHFHKWRMLCYTIESLMHITADGDNDEYSNWKECDSFLSEAYQLKIFRVVALFTLSVELFMCILYGERSFRECLEKFTHFSNGNILISKLRTKLIFDVQWTVSKMILENSTMKRVSTQVLFECKFEFQTRAISFREKKKL